MIQVFMSKRGSGKSKYMLAHANEAVKTTDGHVVFIDDDNRPMHELDRDIRFINTENFEIKSFTTLYGLVCGVLAQDYDVEKIYVDGLLSTIKLDEENAEKEFQTLDKLTDENKVTMYFTCNDTPEVPEYLRKYRVEIE